MPKPWRSDETVKIDPTPCTPSTVYRYSLQVTWKPGNVVAVVGLNPSIADEQQDDKTIRQCIDWARGQGCGGLLMLNAYSFRAKLPSDLKKAPDPFGDQTPEKIVEMCKGKRVVVAWGGHAIYRGRGAKIAAAFAKAGMELDCWGFNEKGSPKHPGRICICATEPWPRKVPTTS
jgi:hypothetical protein